MTLHHQTIYGCPARGDGHNCHGVPGDCLRTVVACVVGCHPSTLTHYAQVVDWWGAMRREARQRWGQDWAALGVYQRDIVQGMGGGWRFAKGAHRVIASGPSPRGKFHHVVVADLVVNSEEDGAPIELRMVHDPHPLGQMLASVSELLIPVGMYNPAPRTLELEIGAA